MFNRQPFNRGKFNRSLVDGVFFSGIVDIQMDAAGEIKAIKSFDGIADLNLVASGIINTVSTFAGIADIKLLASGIMNTTSLFSGAIDMMMDASGKIVRLRNIGEIFDFETIVGFNRMGFNRGKFNAASRRRSVIEMGMSAKGEMVAMRGFDGCAEMILMIDGRPNFVNSFSGNVNMKLFAIGNLNATRTFKGIADFRLSTCGQINVIKCFAGLVHMRLDANSEGFTTFRLEYIEFKPELILRTGDELRIDIQAMTVTLNGENAMPYFTNASEFFRFNPRENEIEYISSNPNDKVDITILWKDAFI